MTSANDFFRSGQDNLISFSGVIQAKNTKFGDMYVSAFASLSLLLIFEPIKKDLVFFSGHTDSWSCMDVNVYCRMDNS